MAGRGRPLPPPHPPEGDSGRREAPAAGVAGERGGRRGPGAAWLELRLKGFCPRGPPPPPTPPWEPCEEPPAGSTGPAAVGAHPPVLPAAPAALRGFPAAWPGWSRLLRSPCACRHFRRCLRETHTHAPRLSLRARRRPSPSGGCRPPPAGWEPRGWAGTDPFLLEVAAAPCLRSGLSVPAVGQLWVWGLRDFGGKLVRTALAVPLIVSALWRNVLAEEV